jgi:hypothetical protein
MGVFLVPLLMLFFRFVWSFLCVDGDVIHVDQEPSLQHFFSEYCVHHHLKGGQ